MHVCERVAVGCGWDPVYRAVSESGLRMKTNHRRSQRKRQGMPKSSARTHKHHVPSLAVAHLCGCGFELQSQGSDLTRLSYIWLAAQCTVIVV